MMRLEIYIITLIIIIGVSCEKNDDLLPNHYTGKISATLNGDSWEASGTVSESFSNKPNLSLAFRNLNEMGFQYESFNFLNVPPMIGVYTLVDSVPTPNEDIVFCSFNTIIGTGDVIGDRWSLALDSTYTIKITNYIPNAGLIEGVINAKLIRTDDKIDSPEYRDTLDFENGVFRVKRTDL